MSTDPQQLETLWDEFLQRWPLEALQDMALTDYTSVGTNDSFCYWLESATEELGSVWGGSSFKFGVYARKDKTTKESGRGRYYSADYGWLEKYGSSPEQAFESVRQEIVSVANAARTGDLASVQNADLGDAIRWKIAFLYQNRDERVLLPIFSIQMLAVITGQSGKVDPATTHQQLLSKQGERPFFGYAQDLWNKADQINSQTLTPEQAQAYFDASSDYQPIKSPTQYIAGYQSLSGKQIALMRQNKNVTLCLSNSGNWLERIRSQVSAVREYDANESRNSNLGANAPELAIGNTMVSLVVDTLSALERVCAAYEEEASMTSLKESNNNNKELSMSTPLNQILCGPPGTGKTYATTEMAVRITEPEWFQDICGTHDGEALREAVKSKYDELVNNGRVAFTTFHQSFSYEDFIEGIRADKDSENNGLTYKLEDGIFKEIADRAEKTVAVQKSLGLAETPNIWKISIGRRQDGEIRQRYLETGEARVGWNWTGDLKVDLDDRSEKQQEYWSSLSNRNHAVLNGFAQEMKVGDVLLCLKDAETVQAVGIITSDYFFDQSAADTDERDYAHARKVNWLLKDINLNILPINNQRRMVQQTAYQLGRISWNTLLAELHKQGHKLPSETGNDTEPEPAPNYVLIIDEINRGNISRIFGELITLLEPDKRKGGADARSVILPYSKEPFTVPDNLYVIGTMNTADKSLAQLDLALRRRFSFVETLPKPELLGDIAVHGVSLKDMLTVINQRIEALLDAEHLIGHSYFMPLLNMQEAEREQALADLFRDRILPLLQEYFFDDYQRIGWVLNDPAKQPDHRFIVTDEALRDRLPRLDKLFPVEVAEQLLDRRYRINERAFARAEAYRGIVK
jgi:5-methylcytosine-specific restriction protein B